MIIEIGKPYFIRTVTDYWTGRVIAINGPNTVSIVDFAWVASTGRLGEFLKNGRAANMEVEAAPDGMRKQVTYLSIDDWPHPLLRETIPSNPNE